jgi:tetratricopeptide (TPR) repeat protein
VGWGWFLGALVPMIGLVQVYMASVADRYSSLAQIGLFLCLAWGAAELAQRLSLRRWVMAGIAGAALALLLLLSTLQTPVWHDELTLWNHALKVTRNNYVALMNLSTYWKNRNEPQKARDYAEQAVQVDPANPAYHAQFGNILAGFGQVEAAVDQYREALRLKPGDAAYLGNLGVAYTRLGRGDEALASFVEALRGNPGDPQNQVNLGSAYAARGDLVRAREAFEQALALDPELFLPHLSLGIFDERAKRLDSALLHLQKAATLAPRDPRPLRQLAQVYAAQGDRVQATKALRSTLTLARAAGNERLAREVEALLK